MCENFLKPYFKGDELILNATRCGYPNMFWMMCLRKYWYEMCLIRTVAPVL